MNHNQRLRRLFVVGLVLMTMLTVGSFSLLAAPPMNTLPDAAQEEGPWTNFSTKDGMASSSILSLAQRDDGVMFVGTNAGLNVLLPDGEWLTFGEADGLGGFQVTDIVLDPSVPHRTWFATSSGLALLDDGGDLTRPDLHTWVNFDVSDGMASASVIDINIDQGGRIWLAHTAFDSVDGEIGGGVSVLDPHGTPFDKSDDGWTVYNSRNSDLASDAVRDILIAHDGVVWFATKNGLSVLSNGAWSTYYATNGLPSNGITNLLLIDDLLWLSTNRSLGVLDTAGTPLDKTDDQSLTFEYYNSELYSSVTGPLEVDAEGNLWISLFSAEYNEGYGANVFDYGESPFDTSDDQWEYFGWWGDFTSRSVRSMVVPSNAGDSVAWFGTADGLNRLDFGESPFGTDDDSILSYTTSVRSPAITVFTVADAGFGRVWVGSDAGLTLFDYSATPHSKADDSWLALNEIYSSVSWSAVRALETDREGRLWVGMSNGLAILTGIDTPDTSWDDNATFYDSTDGLADGRVNDIEIDRYGRMWIASGSLTRGGLQVLDIGPSLYDRNDDAWATFATRNSPAMPSNAVAGIAIDAQDNLWLATNKGAARLNINGSVDNKQDDVWNAFTPGNSGLAYETVRSVQIDAAGNVWFGLNIGGVSVLTPQGGWATFSQADGLVYDSITALTFSPQGALWIGTDGGGVSVLDSHGTPLDKGDDQWTTYRSDDVLLSDSVRAIAFDDLGQAWIGSFGGGLTVYSTFKFERSFFPLISGPEATPTPTYGPIVIVTLAPIPAEPVNTPTATPTPLG
jgi:ligand-binding sensor domain-containing protein